MGKEQSNIPCNVSLSYTLKKFITRVVIEISTEKDIFENEMELNPKSINRFLQHLKNIKSRFNYNGCFRVKSSNNFPHSVGIASSSSSFAALTKCALTAICEIKGKNLPTPEEMSKISREGSGASCRSFFSPWSLWDKNGARGIDLKICELNHDLVLVDTQPKKISSSEAHELVKSSPLFAKRPERAQNRLDHLIDCLNNNQWNNASTICWEEFFDMHSLFETSSPSFRYIKPKTIIILSEVEKFWQENNDGPIVTIDAGPNVHFLWKNDQNRLRKEIKMRILEKHRGIEFL
jgi:diphosphomevalonate decarboxylase